MAIVNEKLEIKAPGNVAGENGNWRFIVDASLNFSKEKRKAGSWDEVDKDYF